MESVTKVTTENAHLQLTPKAQPIRQKLLSTGWLYRSCVHDSTTKQQPRDKRSLGV